MSVKGKVINCRAAVVWGPSEPFKLEEIFVDPPEAGEVRVKIVASGVVSIELLLYSIIQTPSQNTKYCTIFDDFEKLHCCAKSFSFEHLKKIILIILAGS